MRIESIAGRCKLAAQCLTTSGFYAHSLGLNFAFLKWTLYPSTLCKLELLREPHKVLYVDPETVFRQK